MLYVFYGPDQFRAREELNALRRELDTHGDLATNTVRLESRGLSLADLRNACHAASFFATSRLVIVEGLQSRFSGMRRRSTGGSRRPARASSAAATVSELDQFVEVLTALPDSTTVVLLDENPSTAFMEAIEGKARIRQFSVLRIDDVRRWATDRIRAQSAIFSNAALERLLGLVDGNHLGELAQEIDKLVTYANGRQVEAADVDALVSGAMQYQIWDLTDAVIAGRTDRALAFVEQNATSGGRDDFAPQLLIFMLTRQYRQLLLAQALLADRLSDPQVGTQLGLSQYPLRKVIEQARRYPPERVEAAYRRLLETDVAVKTGVLEVATALELLIVDLCELAKTPRPRTPTTRR